ncbi:hypothetical protein R84B8_01801 [Treponema sp. R8-4-B8]
MKINFKTILFSLSLLFNAAFISLLAFSSLSKNSKISCSFTDENSITAACVVNFPKGGKAVFDNLELSLKPGQKALLQYSVISSDQKQANFLVNALFDPSVVSVSRSGYGIEIIALAEGETLMQAVTNDGVKNIALVTVEK